MSRLKEGQKMKNKRAEKMFLIILFGAFLILLPCGGHSAIPPTINYQGYLTNASGVPVNGTVQIVFKIYDVASGGTELWSETQNVTVTRGVYNVELGAVTPVNLVFDVPYYLGVTIGTDPEMTPRKPLSSVGYAFRAQVADYAGGGGRNPMQIALLRWYDANQTGIQFSVGSSPWGIAFDGANIWVANWVTSGTVTKLRANDGANLGSFPVGSYPIAIAFDGANIWVANNAANTVTKLRASDGTNQGTFTVGNMPIGIAFDGANIWVAVSANGTVIKLRASDGANLGTFTFPAGSGPYKIAFDGANIWVINFLGNSVTKLRASDGANLGTFGVGAQPRGIAFDGANIWVTNFLDSSVTKLRASDGANLGTFNAGSSPYGIAFDGANIWVANYATSGTVTKLRASDGANLGTFTVGDYPIGIAFDGANIWVTNSYSNSASKL